MSDPAKPAYVPATFSPKAQFQKQKPLADALGELVHKDWFQSSLTHALAEMQSNMAGGADPQRAWDAHSRMQGAKQLIATLLNLPEVAPVKTADQPGTLNYKA